MGILTASLLHTSAGWSILCLFAAGGLWLIMQGRQFGARLRCTRKKNDVQSSNSSRPLAATYKAAGAHHFCFRMINAWFTES
jgi:hypothetical protein